MDAQIDSKSMRMGPVLKGLSAYNASVKDSEARNAIDAKVMGQLSGRRPFSDAKLRSMGQGWRCNINFRDAGSALEQVMVGYWRLLHDVKDIAHVTVQTKTPDAANYANILQQNFTRFYDDWGDSYVTQYLRLALNHVGFGVGPLVYQSDDSPRYRSLRRGDIILPKRTQADIERFECVWIKQPVTLSEIWGRIRDEKTREHSKAAGWKVDTLRRIATRIHKNQGNGSSDVNEQDCLETERELRSHSLSASITSKSEIIEVHQYVREFDGKIAHYVFYPDFITEETGKKEDYAFSDFSKEKRPEKWRDVLACIFFEIGLDGYYHEVKGFGVKNYDIANAQNRLKSKAMDLSVIEGLNFRNTGGKEPDLNVVNCGPFNIFPQDWEQVQYYPQSSRTIDAIGLLDGQMNSNNARYRENSRQIAETETAKQASILMNLQNQVEVDNATLYLSQVSRVFQVQLERLLRESSDEDAKAFRKRCIEDGIPEEHLSKIEAKITTGATPGAASNALKAQIARELMPIASGNPNFQNGWAEETYITATLGANEVSRALTQKGAASSDDEQVTFALIENDVMGGGTELPVPQSQLHDIHIRVHLQPIEAILQNYQQTQNISPDALMAIQTIMPHLNAHFTYLQQDALRKSQLKELWPRFTQVQSIAEGIITRLTDIEQQNEATGAMPGQAAQMQPTA